MKRHGRCPASTAANPPDPEHGFTTPSNQEAHETLIIMPYGFGPVRRRIDHSNSRHRSLFASRHAIVLTLRQSPHSPDRYGAPRRLLTRPRFSASRSSAMMDMQRRAAQLSRIRSVFGSLNNMRRVVKVQGMFNATPDFKEHPKVIDGFSDLMVEVFGYSGRGARCTRHNVAFKAGRCRNRNGSRS
jgi:hypothetical protein